MTPRVRHCVECPKRHLRYLIDFVPYENGASLVPLVHGVAGAIHAVLGLGLGGACSLND